MYGLSVFSTDIKSKQEESGLSRKWMWLTILSTVIYGIVAIINASRYCLVTTVIMSVVSLGYICLFFKYMRVRK